MDKENQFSQGKLFPLILKYSIPAAISPLITAIYNIVDRIFVGNFNGTSALAGLSICFPLSYKRCAESILDGCSYLCLWVVKRVQSDKPLTLLMGSKRIMIAVFPFSFASIPTAYE